MGKDGFAGIRISTRPDAVDEPMLDCLQQYGVNAIELGAQSMSDRVLACNGRGHTAEQVADASRRIRARGIELGLQMMTGLYGATRQDDIDTAHLLAQLQPSTVRIYPTITLQGTMLERLYRAGEYQPMQLEEAVEECSELLYFLKIRGYGSSAWDCTRRNPWSRDMWQDRTIRHFASCAKEGCICSRRCGRYSVFQKERRCVSVLHQTHFPKWQDSTAVTCSGCSSVIRSKSAHAAACSRLKCW